MIKEYERELNELQESKLISKEDLQEGDEIIYNGEHYFVTLADTGTDFVWITDDESERYNRNAQGWTIKADWIDEVIGQPEEDELEESLKEGWKDFAFIVKCNDGPKELVRVVADNKSKAEEYAKDMYAANHTTYADDRYNVWSIEDKNRSLKEDKVTGKPEDADEKIQFGDEIVYNGKHLFVINANFMDSDRYLWVTDKREDRYNRWAPGKLLAKDLVDKVIRQPDEDGQGDKMNKSIDFTNAADVRHRLDSYSGQYLTITFRGSYDWKYISDLLEEYNDGDEEEADLALDKLEAVYGSEYKLLKALEVDEIRGFTTMDRDIIVTIKVDKDDLYHNYADLINNPSIKKDTVKILELELNESLKKRYKKFLLIENKNKKLKEDWDDEDEEIGYCVLVNGGSPLTFSNKKDAIKKAKELIQDKFNAGKSIHIYKGNLNSESYPGWDDYDEFDGEWKEILKLEAPENFNLNSFDQYVKEKSAYGYEGEDTDPEDLTYEYLDDMSASGLLNIPDKYAKDPDNVDDDEAFAYFDDLIKKYNLVDRVKKMLKESTSKEKTIKEDLDFTDEAEIRKQLAKYSGQYLTITFKGSEDWKHISDLLDESINSDEEEEADLALDKLEASYGREYDLLKSLEVEEISEIVAYTSYVIVTIKVEKDNLLHNFSDNYLDFIHMPSIDTDTIKILELDKSTI